MTQQEAHDLLDRATDDLPLDLERIVLGGVRRGRLRRRNARAVTSVVTAAVVGVIGLGAAFVPLGGGDDGPVATEPTAAPTTAAPTPPATLAPVELAVSAGDFPATVAELAGITDVTGPLTKPPYGLVDDSTGEWLAHFRLDGMLTTMWVFRVADDQHQDSCEESYGTCRAVSGGWIGSRAGEPLDGVRANATTLWRGAYEIGLMSYNAADGKESPTLSEQPRLSPELLEQIVLDDVWFS